MDSNSQSVGKSPSFTDLLIPALSPKTEKQETRTENQMGAIYLGCSHKHLLGNSD